MNNTTRRFGRLVSSLLPALALACVACAIFVAIARADFDDEAAHYEKTAAQDPVAKLQAAMDAGKVRLEYDGRFGYLPSVLKNLGINTSTQGLVFSKTSFQNKLISPHNPRAIYFNDDTYVGFVHDGTVIEVASMDPSLGTVFYVMKQKESARPRFIRQTYDCLQCHQSGMTHGVPGLIMRSVYPDPDGQPILTAGTFLSDDTSPLAQRWGGWYVTGSCGRQQHMGNMTCSDEEHAEKTDLAPTSNLLRLDKRVNGSDYLTGDSDAVALMVLAHQTHLHNLITAANYAVRGALRDSDAMNKALHQPLTQRSEGTLARIHGACEPVVRAMLFCGEARLSDPVAGTSQFAKQFESVGPRDSQGRSLREFDLKCRLFKYRCSYLIYSDQFDGLPEEAKSYIYRRMWEVLTGREDDSAFDDLCDSERAAIMDILRETKKDLPPCWNRKR